MSNIAALHDAHSELAVRSGVKATYDPRRLLRISRQSDGLQGVCAGTDLKGRISGLLNFLLAYFSFLWKKELHVAADDLSGTKDIA